MTAVIPLGRFDKIRLREAWPTEDGHFTPWLAQPDNLMLLGEALGLGALREQQTEVRVGEFRIDILAVDGEGEAVIIENQLERTDHGHLGQLLTYLAAQQNQGTIVWIAENFRAEHRAAIDWLNRNTVEDFSFFGVELELWRIGDSPPAPRFKLVAYPNQWTENVREATREISDPQLLESHRIRLAYWQSFAEFLRLKGSTFTLKRPVKSHVCRFPISPGYRIVALISVQKHLAMVGLSISRDPDRSNYRSLLARKAEIETDFGAPLLWEEKPGAKRSLISIMRASFDPRDSAQYPDVHAWMLEKMERLRLVFEPRIAALPSRAETEDDENE